MKLPVLIPLGRTDWERDSAVVLDQFVRISNANNNPDHGVTGARPTAQLTIGQSYFDTTLGKPIYWRGAVWVDATGAVV